MEKIKEKLVEMGFEDTVLLESPNYKTAIVGYDVITGKVIYSYDLMIEHLMTVEGMTDEEMYNTDRMSDFQKIWDKLNIFAWRTDEEQFKIKVSLKLSRTHGYGFTYRVEFGNNKDNRRCWFRRYLYLSYIDKVIAKEILGDYYLYLGKDKAFNDKLATYKTWDEFYNDINDDVKELTDDCLMRASLAA